MNAIVSNLYIVLAVLSAYVSARFALAIFREWGTAAWERAVLSAGVAILAGALAARASLSYIARLTVSHHLPDNLLHPSFFWTTAMMIVALLFWLVARDWKRRRLCILVPLLAAALAVWVLP